MSTINFKCRKCSGDSLDEIVCGAVISIPVSAVLECIADNQCNCNYDDHPGKITSGGVSHYQCSSCGHILSESELKALEDNP